MAQKFHTICLALPLKMGSVNCYLIETGSGFVLIDTGSSNQRARLARELEKAGCGPGDLRLILLTHGDFDHTGNAAYLHELFGAKLAIHAGDAPALERGDMFLNRIKSNFLIRKLAPVLFGFGKAERCTPDILVGEGTDLSAYGFEARVLHLPGHSKGSIGVLAADGSLFCGDLLENMEKPALNSLMDDRTVGEASLQRLRGLAVTTVYPGHGGPFTLDQVG